MYEHRMFERQPAPGSAAGRPQTGRVDVDALIARGRRERSRVVVGFVRSLGARLRRLVAGRPSAG